MMNVFHPSTSSEASSSGGSRHTPPTIGAGIQPLGFALLIDFPEASAFIAPARAWESRIAMFDDLYNLA
jgi:hypothetical protein